MLIQPSTRGTKCHLSWLPLLFPRENLLCIDSLADSCAATVVRTTEVIHVHEDKGDADQTSVFDSVLWMFLTGVWGRDRSIVIGRAHLGCGQAPGPKLLYSVTKSVLGCNIQCVIGPQTTNAHGTSKRPANCSRPEGYQGSSRCTSLRLFFDSVKRKQLSVDLFGVFLIDTCICFSNCSSVLTVTVRRCYHSRATCARFASTPLSNMVNILPVPNVSSFANPVSGMCVLTSHITAKGSAKWPLRL